MANRYTYSRTIDTIEGRETFTAVEAASFDEAKKEVDKGIRDRRLELGEKHFGVHIPVETTQVAVELKGNDTPTSSSSSPDLQDSPDKLPEGEEGKGAGGAS